MILATIEAREESTHVATAPSRSRRAVSLRCSCCAGDGVAGYSTSAFRRTLRSLTEFGAVGNNVGYDVAINQ